MNFEAYSLIETLNEWGPECNLVVQQKTENEREKFPNLQTEVDIDVT